MRKAIGMTLAAGLALGANGAWAAGELHIFNWGNYTNPELIKKFEEAYDVTVTLDGYDSNDAMLAKVQAGASGYDIVVPSDYMVQIMIKEGLLLKTEPNKMSNFGNMKKEFVDVFWDPGREYSVPWQWGTTGVSVNKTVFDPGAEPNENWSWSLIFDPPETLVGGINVVPEMNDVINAGWRYLGKPFCNGNKDDLKALNDLLQGAKPKWRTMEYGTIEKLTSKDAAASVNWNGASMRARLQLDEIMYVYPKEGIGGWMDNVVVLKDAPNPDNAKLFQDFIMIPENAALISMFARYANGIEGSAEFMDEEMRTAPEINPPAGTPTPSFVEACPREVNDFYTKIWNNLLK